MAGAVDYIDCTSAEGKDLPPTHTPPTNVLDMTLNNLMVRFQQCYSFGGMRRTPSLPSLPGPLWAGVVAPDMGPMLNRTNGILMLN